MQPMGNPFSEMNGLPVPLSGLKYGGECIIAYVNGLVNMVNGHQEKFTSQLEAQAVTLANTETTLRAEISSLRNQLADSNAAREAQKKESDTRYDQMQERLQQLAKTNEELREQMALLAIRVNMPQGGSVNPSFYGGSSRVSVVDMADLPKVDELAQELDKILQE